MIGHNPELKGDVHPIQCSINDGRGQEMPIVSPRTAEVTGAFRRHRCSHYPLGKKQYTEFDYKINNKTTDGCKGKLERWSDRVMNWKGGPINPTSVRSTAWSGYE